MASGIAIQDVTKGYTHDQDKICSPKETIARVRKRLDELDIRILNKTMRIDTGRLNIPVFISLCGPDATAVTGTPKQMGKGLTPEQSETSALMELCERFSFFTYMKNPPKRRLPHAQVADEAMDLDQLFLSLHDEPTDREGAKRILERLPLDWVWARNLTDDRDELVPLDWFFMINEYNGPAAGNCLEEAINQALAEVVERHVASVVDYEKRITPTIDPTSIPDGVAKEALARFEAEGIKVYLKDFSLDTGIPTVAALAWDPEYLGVSEIVFQAGTTTDPEKSVIRALTEVQQMACDFQMPTTYRATLPKFSSLDEAAYLMEGEVVPLSSLPDLSNDNLKTEIEAQVASLARIGLKVYIVNVTHPRLEVPSVYCIVPGAHFRFRTRDGSALFHAAKLASGHPDEAECLTVLEEIAKLDPTNYSFQFFSGLAMEWAGRPAEALDYFTQALELGPSELDRPAVLTHIGVSLRELDRPREALDYLAQAAELDARQWEIRHQMGVCHYKLGEFQAAMDDFLAALEIDHGSGIDYANVGSCLREMGQTEEAIKMYKMALELDPSLDFARDNIERLSAK